MQVKPPPKTGVDSPGAGGAADRTAAGARGGGADIIVVSQAADTAEDAAPPLAVPQPAEAETSPAVRDREEEYIMPQADAPAGRRNTLFPLAAETQQISGQSPIHPPADPSAAADNNAVGLSDDSDGGGDVPEPDAQTTARATAEEAANNEQAAEMSQSSSWSLAQESVQPDEGAVTSADECIPPAINAEQAIPVWAGPTVRLSTDL